MFSKGLVVVLALSMAASAACFQVPMALRSPLPGKMTVRSTCTRPASMQFATPDDAPIRIPDTFNPAEWNRGGSGGGLGGGLGGFSIPDTFNPNQLEREKERGRTAVLDRPKLDPGKKYKVLLFNDENNTRQYVIDTLTKCIPGVTVERAKEITEEAHNTGMAIVGIWMFELAEAYADILSSAGLNSNVEEA